MITDVGWLLFLIVLEALGLTHANFFYKYSDEDLDRRIIRLDYWFPILFFYQTSMRVTLKVSCHLLPNAYKSKCFQPLTHCTKYDCCFTPVGCDSAVIIRFGPVLFDLLPTVVQNVDTLLAINIRHPYGFLCSASPTPSIYLRDMESISHC